MENRFNFFSIFVKDTIYESRTTFSYTNKTAKDKPSRLYLCQLSYVVKTEYQSKLPGHQS